jgi:hypothetical protein
MILCGYFNCPIDKETRKTKEVLSFLQEEGLKLISDKDSRTYICHNGMSTIDLVFTKGFTAVVQNQSWKQEKQ